MDVPTSLRFVVEGIPVPQGSMKAFMNKHMKYPVIVSDNVKLKRWRKLVADLARLEMRKAHLIPIGKNVPMRLLLDFYFDKEPSVTRLDKTTKPDLDKLVRAIGDALKGAVFEDDAQVTELSARKLYGSPARVEIEVHEADFPPHTLIKPEPIRDCDFAF